MIMQRGGSVYIMTNPLRTVVYTGVTSDLRTEYLSIELIFIKAALRINIIVLFVFTTVIIVPLMKLLLLRNKSKSGTERKKTS